MNPTLSDKRTTHLKERNQKISSILVLLITIFEKIEKLKQKLCGFSPTQFSPQSIFEALDLTGKGYLDTYDIHSFLGNDSIRDKDILILFSRLGDQGQGRLTYLGYLSMLKPFFDYELARDLLLRDTVTHRKNRAENEDSLHEMQQTVLILLNELILLHCICIAEHQTMKTALIEEYMLNEIEIREILGLGGKVPALTAIHEFIQCNSEFDIDKNEVKYILSLTQCNQISLPQQKCLNILFLPSRPILKRQKKQTVEDIKSQYEREFLHANYTKQYIGKDDLIVTSNRLSFLNYIHPNSFDKPAHDAPVHTKNQEKHHTTQQQIDQEHKKLSVPTEKSYRPFKQDPKPTKDRQMSESIVEKSNLHQIKRPQSSRLQPYSMDRIDTPVLEQFMHESNIKRNMGNYRGRDNLELKVLIEESVVSSSDGIQRVDYTSKQSRFKAEPNRYIPPPKKVVQGNTSNIPNAYISNNSSNQYSRYMNIQNKSNISYAGDTSGILNQFLKSEFK